LPRRTFAGAAAAAAATMAILGGLTVSTQQGLVDARRQLRASDQALGLIARPNARFVALSGKGRGYVRLVHDATIRKGALIVADLHDPGKEMVYQVWLRGGEDRHSPGVFRPERGHTMVMPIEADFHRFQLISITIETGPRGVDRISHPPVMAGRF
jgi:anti-sigma-K factor RskA